MNGWTQMEIGKSLQLIKKTGCGEGNIILKRNTNSH